MHRVKKWFNYGLGLVSSQTAKEIACGLVLAFLTTRGLTLIYGDQDSSNSDNKNKDNTSSEEVLDAPHSHSAHHDASFDHDNHHRYPLGRDTNICYYYYEHHHGYPIPILGKC